MGERFPGGTQLLKVNSAEYMISLIVCATALIVGTEEVTIPNFSRFFLISGVAATYWPIVPAPDDR
jgi:hypothetical protein